MTTSSDVQFPDLATLLQATARQPEHAFGLDPLALVDDDITGRTGSHPLPRGLDGAPAAGSVGVLADDVLGFAIIAAARRPAWSVSVEISLDFVAPLPDTGGLQLRTRGSDLDGSAGFADGALLDDRGRTVVLARQHSRYVPLPALPPEPYAPATEERPEDVVELLGATTTTRAGSCTLTLADPREWLNPLGVLHGGVGICAAEAAATAATLDSMVSLRTTSLSIVFARPMAGTGPLTFEAHSLHQGRTLRMIEVVGSVDGRACTFAKVVRQAVAEETR